MFGGDQVGKIFCLDVAARAVLGELLKSFPLVIRKWSGHVGARQTVLLMNVVVSCVHELLDSLEPDFKLQLLCYLQPKWEVCNISFTAVSISVTFLPTQTRGVELARVLCVANRSRCVATMLCIVMVAQVHHYVR